MRKKDRRPPSDENKKDSSTRKNFNKRLKKSYDNSSLRSKWRKKKWKNEREFDRRNFERRWLKNRSKLKRRCLSMRRSWSRLESTKKKSWRSNDDCFKRKSRLLRKSCRCSSSKESRRLGNDRERQRRRIKWSRKSWSKTRSLKKSDECKLNRKIKKLKNGNESSRSKKKWSMRSENESNRN